MESAECLKERIWVWSVERRLSVHSEKELYCMAEKRRSVYWVKTDVMGAVEASLQHLSKKAPMKGKTMSRAR